MRKIAITVFLLLGAMHAQAVCHKYEYAELKDESKEDLLHNYCLYKGYARIDLETFHKLLPIDSSEADKYRVAGDDCGTEYVRVANILHKFHGVKDGPAIDCEALAVRWKRDREAEENKKR